MPSKRKVPKQLFALLRESINVCMASPPVLLAFATIAFIQLLVLEILYFSPRFPLAVFFNPIVRTLWGEEFTHYPNNFMILPKLFQNTQVFIYIFVSSFFIAVAIGIISAINNGKKINFRMSCADTLKQYIHIFTGAVISFGVFFGLYKLYSMFMTKILKFSAIDGIFFVMKQVMLHGLPYVNLLLGVFVTAIFAFVFPIIVIENKKILAAIGLNFKKLWGSFWFIFLVVLIPTLFYLPVLFMRYNISGMAQLAFPEIRVLALVLSILVTMVIDMTVYTAITTYYLLKKEYA